MAVLLVELHGIKRGSVLPRRVLIGRRSMNHLVIDDPGVSRMHAWIAGEGDRYYINDAGSRTGTLVNGQRIVARHLLGDEDEITIGAARLTFLAESRLRPGVAPIDLASPPKVAAAEKGILFDCPACKAPLWASENFAGGTGQCKYCGNALVVPGAKAAKAQPAPPGRIATQRPAPKPAPVAPAALRGFPPQAGNAPLAPDRSVSAARPARPTPPASPVIPQDRRFEANPISPGDKSRKQNAPRPDPVPANLDSETALAATNVATLERPPTLPAAPTAAVSHAVRRTSEGEQICGVCQSAISVFEEQASCPSCGLVFHADCWAENFGCSAYGCPQVNALAPPHEHSDQTTGAEHDGGGATNELAAVAVDDDKPARFPWEFVLLAGSVFSALVGALTFGLPSLALAGGTVTYMARTRRNGSGAHRGIIMLSAGLALLGVIAGIPVSWFLYFGGPHL